MVQRYTTGRQFVYTAELQTTYIIKIHLYYSIQISQHLHNESWLITPSDSPQKHADGLKYLSLQILLAYQQINIAAPIAHIKQFYMCDVWLEISTSPYVGQHNLPGLALLQAGAVLLQQLNSNVLF